MFNPTNDQETTQEQLRRQQIMRLGLVVCLLFLMLDNGAKPAGRVAPPASVSYAHGLPLDSTLSQQVRDALEPTQGVGMGEIKPFNATGLFRGAWLARRPSVIGGGSSKGGGVDAGAGVGAGLGVWGAGAGADAGGSVFLQLVSVPLLPLPDISFLYGVLRLYRNTNPAAGGKGVGGMGVGGNVGGVGIAELSLPIQGLVVSSRRQLYLFATPRKAQRLYLQMTPGAGAGVGMDVGTGTGVGQEAAEQGQRRLKAAIEAAAEQVREMIDIEEEGRHGTPDWAWGAWKGAGGAREGAGEGAFLGDGAGSGAGAWNWARDGDGTRDWAVDVQGEWARDVEGGWGFSMGSPMRGLQRAARRVLAAALTPTTPATHTDIHTAQSRQLGVDIGAGGVGVGREWLDSEVLLGGTEASGYLRLFVADAPPSTSTTPTPSNSTTPTLLGAVAFGESSLPSRFKALQSAGASKAAAIEGLRRNWGRSTGTGGTGGAGAGGNVTRDKGDKGDTDAYSNATMALLESFLQSRSPADCPFSGALSLLSTNAYSTASESASVSASASTSTPSSNSTPASIPASISASIPDSTLADSASTSESAPTSPVPTLSSADEDGAGKGAGGTGTDAGAGTGVGTGRQGVGAWAASTGGVGMVGGTGMGSQGVGAVGGLVGSTSCGRSFILYAQAFSAQLGALTRKVELYSLVATFVTLLQVCLCVLQLRVSASQSVAGRTSIVGIFAQSLLDALLCMGHLTLSFALPSVFFASFIWICLLQLLLFSVFQMRLVVNAYQSRHAQELQQEGWQGLRQRLVHLHIRFYAVVMASLLLSVSLYTRPVLAVLLLFSHWLPQILFSAYDGTKPPFHPAYLLGTAAARLFIPLYLLGCPNNFLTELNNHFGMQALQTSAAAAALSLSLSLPATAATAATAAATAATATAAVTATANAAAAAASVAATTGTTSQAACLVLLLWTVVQVGVLLLQGRLGPRFFFPKSWLPQRYDYSRQVPPALAVWQEEEQGQGQEQGRGQGQEQGGGGEGGGGGAPSSVGVRSRSSGGWFGASSPSPPSSDTARAHTHADSDDDDLEAGVEMGLLGQRGAECVICYNRILLRANDYSITPCDHLFHQQCLRTWLDLKLECPICRSALPTMD